MADKLTVLATEADKYRKNAREFLIEKAEEGFERVIVMGWKDDSMHYSCSATPNTVEDIGAMVLAILDRAGATRRPE